LHHVCLYQERHALQAVGLLAALHCAAWFQVRYGHRCCLRAACHKFSGCMQHPHSLPS